MLAGASHEREPVNLDRLGSASGPYGTKIYQYDSFGNRTQDPDNIAGSWGFDTTSSVTSQQGAVQLSNGRIAQKSRMIDLLGSQGGEIHRNNRRQQRGANDAMRDRKVCA